MARIKEVRGHEKQWGRSLDQEDPICASKEAGRAGGSEDSIPGTFPGHGSKCCHLRGLS